MTNVCLRRWGRWPTHARAGDLGRVALERVDGEPVLGSPWEPLLAASASSRAAPAELRA